MTLSFERWVDRTSLILVVVTALATLVFYSGRAAFSLALGGLLSAINFHWLKNAVDYVVLKGAEGPVGKRVAVKYAGRYALIGLTLYVTLRFSVLDPVLILTGLFIYVFAVLLESILEIAKSLFRDYRNGRTSASNR